MADLDWMQILQGLGGGEGPSPIPLGGELSQPEVGTGGVGTGPGTMGRPLLTPPYVPPPTPPQPAAALTPNEGTVAPPAPMTLSPPGTGLRGRQGEDNLGAVLAGNAPTPLPATDPRKLAMQGGGGGAQGPITLGGPGGPAPFAGGTPATPTDQAKKAAGLAAALKGVSAPAAPAVQKISTPNAPRPTGTIKGGDLQALLSALNAAPGASGIKLPTTLGSSIGR